LLFLVFASGVNGQYVGSSSCATCHPDKAASQSRSGHAHALAAAPPGSPGQWAFGAGAKATTYVSRTDEDTYVEHGLTYYPSTKSMGLTPGHSGATDVTYATFDPTASIMRCFRCHSTGELRLNAGFTIEPAENGVRCEACHGPGAAHVHGNGAAGTIRNPKQLNAAELNQFCGTCHRKAPEAGEEKDWSNSWNTRHQPTSLSQAACFRLSAGALSCLTCHDPHSPVNRSAADYDKRCSSCHRSVRHATPTAAATCISCHMPQVQTTPQLRFTNHWIGVYAKGVTLVPGGKLGRSLPPLALQSTGPGKLVAPNDPSTLRPLFEQALMEREKQLGPAHPKVARGAASLGQFLAETGDRTGAEAPLRRALDIDRANGDTHLPEDEEKLAQLLEVAGKRREAFELLQQAAGGADLHVAARSFAGLAVIDPAKADLYYGKGLAAEEAASGKDDPKVAILLNNLALALKEKGDLKTAEPSLRRALAIQRKAFGPGHYQTATTLNNLGSLLQSSGRLREAEALEREALRSFEGTLPQSTELATVCTNLADLLAARGGRVEAAGLLRKAVSIDESIYGTEDPEVAADLTNLGVLLRESGAHAAADSALKRALNIYEKRLGPDSRQARDIRDNLQRR
jgi:tetratricopeptide (TPR) repeat protein